MSARGAGSCVCGERPTHGSAAAVTGADRVHGRTDAATAGRGRGVPAGLVCSCLARPLYVAAFRELWGTGP